MHGMLLRGYIICLCLAFTNASLSFKSTASTAVKEGNIIGGFEGLDINWAGVFNLDGYVVGLKYALNPLNGPLSIPESLFAKRSFNTAGSGKLNIDTAFDFAKNKFSIYSGWFSDKYGLAVSAVADTSDKLKEVTIRKTQDAVLGVDKISSSVRYDLQNKVVSLIEVVARGETAVEIKFDNKDFDPIVTLSQQFNDDFFSPSISVKTGTAAYGWKRNLSSGSIDATLRIGKKFTLTWRDIAMGGAWVTKATVPLDDPEKKTKITVAREFF